MLLRQKAIVEGGLALVLKAAMQADLAAHAATPDEERVVLKEDRLNLVRHGACCPESRTGFSLSWSVMSRLAVLFAGGDMLGAAEIATGGSWAIANHP